MLAAGGATPPHPQEPATGAGSNLIKAVKSGANYEEDKNHKKSY